MLIPSSTVSEPLVTWGAGDGRVSWEILDAYTSVVTWLTQQTSYILIMARKQLFDRMGECKHVATSCMSAKETQLY